MKQSTSPVQPAASPLLGRVRAIAQLTMLECAGAIGCIAVIAPIHQVAGARPVALVLLILGVPAAVFWLATKARAAAADEQDHLAYLERRRAYLASVERATTDVPR